jgi:ribosome-associated translation inhibitor RaiA
MGKAGREGRSGKLNLSFTKDWGSWYAICKFPGKHVCSTRRYLLQLPVQITFRNTSESKSISHLIEEESRKLDHFYPRIMACRVAVEVPHRHQHKGKLYQVRVDLTIPRKEIVVNRVPAERAAHSDAYLAVRHAFRQARRQLQEYTQSRRG